MVCLDNGYLRCPPQLTIQPSGMAEADTVLVSASSANLSATTTSSGRIKFTPLACAEDVREKHLSLC